MKAEDQRNLNNLYQRYQSYDDAGTKYAYDIHFTTLSSGRQLKVFRDTGVDRFRQHIDALMNQFKDVHTITVTDYTGKSKKCLMLNDPVEIYLLDVKDIANTPKVIIQGPAQQPQPTQPQATSADIFQGLKGLFTGTKFEGLGDVGPIAGFIDAGHTIDRLREKNSEQENRISELERNNAEWQQKYEALNDVYDQLQDDADDMEEELSSYRDRDRKNDRLTSLAGAVIASGAKTFLRQNPGILSGLIPAEQLAGMLSDDEPAPAPAVNHLSDDDRERMDDIKIVFEWLQTLSPQSPNDDEPSEFDRVMSVISVLRQNSAYADRIIELLNIKS